MSATPYIEPKDLTAVIARETALVAVLKSKESLAAIAQGVRSSGVKDEAVAEQAERVRMDAVAYVTERREDGWATLVQCTPESVVGATAKLAAQGLSPNALNGDGFLTPRKIFEDLGGGQRVWLGFQAVPIPGVRGTERLLRESGAVRGLRARAVFSQDLFEVTYGTKEEIRHVPNVRPSLTIPNPIIAAYCIVELKSGDQHHVVKKIDPKLDLQGRRMTPEKQAAYLAQRAATRDVIRTYISGNKSLMALVEMEDAGYSVGEAVEDARRNGVASAPSKQTPMIVESPPVVIQPAMPPPAPTSNLAPVSPAPEKAATPVSSPPRSGQSPVDGILQGRANGQAFSPPQPRPPVRRL